MWHLTHIPKQVHFYWGGGPLSYLRALSVKTFQQLNPDWQVTLHRPAIVGRAQPTWSTMQQKNSQVTRDYMDQLTGIDIQTHDFADYGFDNHAHEVHKSDFLRWLLLSTVGGVWSDIDILYCRPITALRDNHAGNSQVHMVLCPLKPPKKHTVGFLMSSAGNEFCAWMHKTSGDCYDPEVYQCMGSDILNENFADLCEFEQRFGPGFLFLDPGSVYGITSKEIQRFYQPVDAHTAKKTAKPGCIGLHWFAGHPESQQFENGFDPATRWQFNNLLTKTLQDFHET